MRATNRLALLGALVGVTMAMPGCENVVERELGFFEPIRVIAGAFVKGELERAPEDSATVVTAVEVTGGVILVGQSPRTLNGRVTEDAHAVGVRFTDLGSGWWTVPAQELDAGFPGERIFGLRWEVGYTAPPGLHEISVAGIDGEGRRGPSQPLQVCVVDDAFPKGLFSCDPSIPPPSHLVTLEWASEMDLDLVIQTPSGKRVGWKFPTTGESTDTGVPPEELSDPSTGRLLWDANAFCSGDTRTQESVVWIEPPDPGLYLLYADVFEACGVTSTYFQIVVYSRRQNEDDTWSFVERKRFVGGLDAVHASGGVKPPLYVGSFRVE